MQDRSGMVIFRKAEITWSTCFASDLARIYTNELRERGHEPPCEAAIDELGRLLQDWRRRRLEHLVGRSVRVHHSRELDAQGENPTVGDIAARARAGEPLWPYTSRETRAPGYEDDLLNHWGILHFHLGRTFRADGYAARTGALLYARATAEDLYLLAIGHHRSFADNELLNIAIRNWPETFEPSRLIGVSIAGAPASPHVAASGKMAKFTRTVMMHPTRAVTSERTKELRAQGLNATFEAETGAHYYPPGGGYSCAGTGLLSGIHADHEIWFAEQLARTIATEIVQVATKLSECAPPHEVAEMKFRLKGLEEMKRAIVFEENTQVAIQLPNEFDHSFDPAAFMKVLAAPAIMP